MISELIDKCIRELLAEGYGQVDEAINPKEHYTQRVSERVVGVSDFTIPQQLEAIIPKGFARAVRIGAANAMQPLMKARLKQAEETEFDPIKDRDILYVVKYARLRLRYNGKVYKAFGVSDYTHKKNDGEGIGDLYYAIVHNGTAFTLILRDSAAGDQDLKRDALLHYERKKQAEPHLKTNVKECRVMNFQHQPDAALDLVIDVGPIIDEAINRVAREKEREGKGGKLDFAVFRKTPFRKNGMIPHTEFGEGRIKKIVIADDRKNLFFVIDFNGVERKFICNPPDFIWEKLKIKRG